MFGSIKHNLATLFNPRGRDGRRIFWLYFLFVLVLNVAVVAAVALPQIFVIVGEIGQNSLGKSSPAVEAAVMDKMIAAGLPATLIKAGLGLGILNIFLLASAFVRRAHDAGLPGMVVVIPVGLQLIWVYFSFRQLGGIEEKMRSVAQSGQAAAFQPGMIAQDMIGWLVVLVVALVGFAKTQKGSNQYGEAPVKL